MAEERVLGVTTPSFIGQDIPCPLCQSTHLVFVGTHDRHGHPLKTDLCKSCGHVFTNPQPTQSELDNYYGERYRSSYKGVVTPKLKHVYRAGLRAQERLDHLETFLSSGSTVLDIGAGGGEFVYLANRHGFRAQGIEPNQGYATYAKAEYGVPINIGTVESLDQSKEQWDAITLHHVLEHLADPISILKKLSALLADEGSLVVEIPNVMARYHSPKRRFHFAHLHTFSEDGIAFAAGKAGLSVCDVTLQPHTNHIRVVLKRGSITGTEDDPSQPERIERHLARDTPWRDTFTGRPYRRLWANAKRPIKEWFALNRLGSPDAGKTLLDRLDENRS